jgi:hypothetical protein
VPTLIQSFVLFYTERKCLIVFLFAAVTTAWAFDFMLTFTQSISLATNFLFDVHDLFSYSDPMNIEEGMPMRQARIF